MLKQYIRQRRASRFFDRLPVENLWLVRLNAIASIATAFGLFLTCYQLYSGNQDRRVDAALHLVDQFSHGDLGQQRRLLDTSMLRHTDSLQKLTMGNYTASDKSVFVREILLRGSDDYETARLRAAVVEVADAFDRIFLCTRVGRGYRPRCDTQTISEYFCDYAISFDSLYGLYLSDVARDLKTYRLGESLKEFSGGPLCSESRHSMRAVAITN